MFVPGIVLLVSLSGLMSQSVFDPPSFTLNSCTGNNQWTTWFDTSDPNFSQGEFEVTNHIKQQYTNFMCPDPIAIEVNSMSHAHTLLCPPPSATGLLYRL
jgi:hypothetical protein